jgi:phosphatidate cytidylyltransferase
MSDQHPPDARSESSGSLASRLGSDFQVRLASGIAMAIAAVALTVVGSIPFSVLVAAVALLVSWEWARLVHGSDYRTVLVVLLGTTAVAAVLAALGYVALGLLVLPIGAILATVLSLGRNSVYSALGVFYAGFPAVALIWLRSDPWHGLLATIFVIAIVATSDTAAFFSGRLFRGPLLWERISPKKTWSGMLGALIACAVVGALFWFAIPHGSALRLGVTGAVLSLVAQAGDLAESALKRRFGAKDAGDIIPGHGGVMDRVDGIIAAASAVGLVAVVVDVYSPARALLFGL